MRDDDRLIRAMRRGDESALAEVIDRYTAYAGAIVWGIAEGKMDLSDAKELLSDVFYTLWKNAGKIQPGKLRAYLGAIARSRALNALRGRGMELTLEDDWVEISAAQATDPADEVARREDYAALRRAVDGLPEPDRTIFIRHYYLYQPTARISESMDINVNTVQSKLRRGRALLRQELEKGGYFVE